MDNKGTDNSQVGRYQIAASAGDYTHILTILDTATGKVWVREVSKAIGGNRKLLERENQGKAFWEIPN